MYVIDPGSHFQQLDSSKVLLPTKSLAEWIYRDNWPEKSLVDWCAEVFAKSDKLFLDIGAHVGSYSWSLASKFRHVHAFEPNREVYNALCANSLLKGVSHRITTHCLGLSNGAGKKDYYVRSQDGGGNGFSYLGAARDQLTPTCVLETRTLDSYGFEDVGFMKIDVEGHEIEVLEGALATLEKSGWPPFIFESWASWRDTHDRVPASELREKLFSYIHQIGYKIVSIRGYDEIFIAERA